MLEGLIGPRKAVILMVFIYYSGKIHIKIIKRKRQGTWGEVQEKSGASFQMSFPSAIAEVHAIA